MVRDERADAAHLGAEPLDELEVERDVARGLVGRAHHEAAADHEPHRAQVAQAGEATLVRHLGRVQARVVNGVGRLVAQQVAVGAGVVKRLVDLARALPHRQGDGAVAVGALDARHHVAEALVVEGAVLPALEHEGAKAQVVALLHARHDLLGTQAVALAARVGAPKPAVEAVVSAVTGDLDEAADVHRVAEDATALIEGAPCRQARELG